MPGHRLLLTSPGSRRLNVNWTGQKLETLAFYCEYEVRTSEVVLAGWQIGINECPISSHTTLTRTHGCTPFAISSNHATDLVEANTAKKKMELSTILGVLPLAHCSVSTWLFLAPSMLIIGTGSPEELWGASRGTGKKQTRKSHAKLPT